jgi:hypothetical protein
VADAGEVDGAGGVEGFLGGAGREAGAPELAAKLTAQGLVSEPMSVSSLLRILAGNPVRPWLLQSWICPATGTSRRKRP